MPLNTTAPPASQSCLYVRLIPANLCPAPRPIDAAFSTWLNLFRWVAAFCVCSSHLRALLFESYRPDLPWLAWPFYLVTGFGHEAVIIFFVLSGYLVGGEVLRGLHRGDFDGRTYAIKRFARLYAVYPLALLLGAAWDNLGLHFFNGQELYTKIDPACPMLYFPVVNRLTLDTFAGNLLFLQGLITTPFGSNSALWSLANEAWYYALFPLLVWPIFSQGPLRGKVISLTLLATGAWFVRGDILVYSLVWAVGLLPHFLRHPLLSPGWLAPSILAVCFALLRLHAFAADRVRGHLLLALAFALWLNRLAHGTSPPRGGARLHRTLADFSYSLYLGHWPFLLLICAILNQQFGVGYRMRFGMAPLLLAGLLLALAYGYAWILAHLTERHSPALRGRLLGTKFLASRP